MMEKLATDFQRCVGICIPLKERAMRSLILPLSLSLVVKEDSLLMNDLAFNKRVALILDKHHLKDFPRAISISEEMYIHWMYINPIHRISRQCTADC